MEIIELDYRKVSKFKVGDKVITTLGLAGRKGIIVKKIIPNRWLVRFDGKPCGYEQDFLEGSLARI